MAVYTVVAESEAAALLRRLGLGELRQLRGIRSGIENTNYFASTSQGEWVLTLFERLAHAQLPYFMRLMQHLAAAGLPVPWPQGRSSQQLVHTLAGKPAAVVTRLYGEPVAFPALDHCAQLGAMLGRLHCVAGAFELEQPHGRGLDWCVRTLPEVLPHVAPEVAARLQQELLYQQAVAESAAGRALPRGPIHADLFRDNAMFVRDGTSDRLSGLLDFYFAGTDTLLFDVAVCLNDWCIDDETARLDEARAGALLDAYRAERPLAHGEWRLLPAMMRAAALRFWLSRLWDWHLPREASLLAPKDPAHFERVLQQRIQHPWLPDS
jgi:homoserine kinase type II